MSCGAPSPATPEARARGFGPARFSFNTGAGGRCQACEGQGSVSHEMSFLPDVTTPCEACGGMRFDAPTREVRYHGLDVGEVLHLTVEEAREVFSAMPRVASPLQCLVELGVGYLQLGQGSHTLSGGEAQRLKLAAELTASARHEPTLYVLDEPTTGLHLSDVEKLVRFLGRLVDRGDTLVVIEHHPAVIAAADHVVELGPEGGEAGGRIVAEGPPARVARKDTATGQVLRALLGRHRGCLGRTDRLPEPLGQAATSSSCWTCRTWQRAWPGRAWCPSPVPPCAPPVACSRAPSPRRAFPGSSSG